MNALLSRLEHQMLYLSGFLLLGVVAAVALIDADNAADRWLTIALLVPFGAILIRMGQVETASLGRISLFFGGQTALILVMAALISPVFTLLFFLLSVHAMTMLPPRLGLVWIGVFVLASSGLEVSRNGWLNGSMTALVNGAAYFFFGAFGNALVRVEVARRESQRLLQELQVAHQQLQAYADQVETLAVAEERTRLARDLHDTLGHRLTASIVQLEGAERLIARNPERAEQIVNTVRQQLSEGLNEVRQTVAILRTPTSVDPSLPSALKQLIGNFSAATQLEIQTAIPDTVPPLPDGHRLALYRAAQEALTNIQRHAQAQTAWLNLEVGPETILLRVSDDGLGLADNAEQRGFGLRGMRERAGQLGGAVRFEARPEGGAHLIFELPRPLEKLNGHA